MDYKIIYIRTTENCNLKCKHCFVPYKQKRISLEQIEKIVKILKENFSKNKLVITWHGGEPTLLPPNFYMEAIEKFFYRYFDKKQLKFEMQTNLMIYNKNWKEYIQKYQDNYISVSYDFEIRTFKNSAKEFEKRFFENLEKVYNDNININWIITVTKIVKNIGINNFFNFLIKNKKYISGLHLEKLTYSGNAKTNWLDIGITNKEWNNFMYNLFLKYITYLRKEILKTDDILLINNFINMLYYIPKNQKYSCSGSCKNFFTFDVEGNIKGCTALEGFYNLGNLKKDIKNLSKLNEENVNKLLNNRIDFYSICKNCEYKNICNGGCLANPNIIDDSGDCLGNIKIFEYIKRNIKPGNIIYEFVNKLKLSNKEIMNSFN